MADTYYWFAYLQKPEDKEVMMTMMTKGCMICC